ncbi:RagB/SusD family nutrient uptake outer membrane protein [Winogradskyella sp. F6397]|uniref:RagB/SusD family nutrient uptake outer membrane protein n=1 Tax=Winogradskyella marina TaxID=2785530 RepID=A0ABS0ECS9_9FLAO|nr:RagB/SusD family nutrient uptake outer membrane protein [Winogradskyella marina]MBF8148267.1 RagB/SusD family nutrient uptake outer membrane protein [Winogradskyella marina]
MKKIIIYSLVICLFTSCELVDVLENDPPNNLVEENVVQSETDARALLNGVYTTITSRINDKYYMFSELIPSAMIGSMNGSGTGTSHIQFSNNSLEFDNIYVRDYWLMFYKTMDIANNTIKQTNQLSGNLISETSRKEIIGEARFLRAMSTFDALRYYGQFFDESSNLGIVLRTEPSNFVTRNKARNTVAECYEQILLDLDAAILDAPDYSVTYRASKTAAKALKAKVLLYQGKYAEAAALADQVINDGTTSLAPDFESVFSQGLNSSEMILMTYRDANSDTEDNNRKRFYSGIPPTDNWFTAIMDTDPRKAYTYNDSDILKTNNEEVFRPTYFLRLAEMYLIKAEGLAFSGASLADASAPLNIIRNRAGIGNTSAANIEALKEDIFNEIARELAFENGSEWFAAIRFNKAMLLKPSIISSNQYILPIPEEEINGNGSITFTDQNPGYE